MILTCEQIKENYPGADIRQGAVIGQGAVIREGAVILQGAIIGQGAVIREGAVILQGAIIREGAVIRQGAVIEKGKEGIVLHGAYKYSAGAYYDSKKKKIIIRLGCHHRTIEEWDSDFDNNLDEFPRDSEERKKRWNTLQILKMWAIENLSDKEPE